MSKAVDIQNGILHVHTRHYDDVQCIVLCTEGRVDRVFMEVTDQLDNGIVCGGNCTVCGRPLENGRLYLCERCQLEEERFTKFVDHLNNLTEICRGIAESTRLVKDGDKK